MSRRSINTGNIESGDNPIQPQGVQLLPMTMDDVPEIIELENICFPEDPWPVEVYTDELCCNPNSFYWLVRPRESALGPGLPTVLANGGYNLEESSTHITTLATHPKWRRRKIGEWLLLNMLRLSRQAGSKLAYLEVRVDNIAALKMYLKLGFLQVKQLERYYRSKSGAAYVLVLYDLDSDSVWQPLLQALDTIVIDLSE